MNKLKSLYEAVLNIGVYSESKEHKQIRLLNSFCITWGLLIIPFAIADLFFSNNIIGSFVIHSIGLSCMFIVFWAQKNKKYTLARFSFLIILTILISLFTNFVEVGRNLEIVYFLVPLMSLLIVKDHRINLFFLVLCFVLFYVPNVVLNHYDKLFKNPVIILSVFVGGYVILNYSQSLNSKKEAEILKSKKELEFAYEQLEDRKQSELAHLQLKSLKAQMNPHFMFNAMNSIQSLVLKGDKHEAYNYLTKFASLIRENLNMSEKSFVDFEEELSLLKKYLELERLRFRDNFEYEIIGEENVTDVKIPSMIIQPFVENSIKHGLLHKLKGVKKVSISFYEEEVFKCVIIDNGIGMKASKEINSLSFKEESFSTKAIEDRLSLLKDYYKTDIGFKYEKIKEGTKVVIKIPYINSNE